MNGSNVTAMGRLTRDASLKTTSGGTAVMNNSLALKSGRTNEDDSFIDITVWGKAAEFLDKYGRKGARVLICGELKQERWEGRDGDKRSKVVIHVREANLIDWPEDGDKPEKPDVATTKDDSDLPF